MKATKNELAKLHICKHIYIYIYSPTPVGLSSLANEVIALPLAFIARLFIYLSFELSVAVKRMYVNNSNCDL